MSHCSDFYIGAYSDVEANGIPACCKSQDFARRNSFHATNPGDESILHCQKGTDITGTFLTTWSGPHDEGAIKRHRENIDNGYEEA